MKKTVDNKKSGRKFAKKSSKPAKQPAIKAMPRMELVKAEEVDPLADRDQILKSVNSWRSYIRKLLNEDETYKRKFTYQVQLAAQSLRLLQECYIEIMRGREGERFTVSELSRENNTRRSVNPLITAYCKIDAMCRANLRALGMNLDKVVGSNPLGEGADMLKTMMEKMAEE